MSSILLDTHALIWFDSEPTKLTQKVSRVLRSASTKVFVSPVSVYEIAYKDSKKKLDQATDLVQLLEARLRVYDFEVLPITHKHALRAAQLDWEHRDPFDRIIAAQALIEKCILVTRDSAFVGVQGLKTMW